MSKIESYMSTFEIEKFNERKLQFRAKEDEGIAGAIEFSQGLAG